MSSASFDALGTDRDLGSEAYRPADFPGCESFHLPASEIDHTKAVWSSGTASPRRPGRSASPPPFSTSSRPGCSGRWRDGSR